MNQFYEKYKIELGIDEAGRGCLLGPVSVGAVILGDLSDNPPPYEIKDSKKCSAKKRKILRQYIEENAIAFNVQFVGREEIDKVNILQATILGMHRCIDEIVKTIKIDRILVDGSYFPYYTEKATFEIIPHVCIPGGDNEYLNIAAASILAKEYRDEYVSQLCNENPILDNYDVRNNKGYGTKSHMEALKDLGPTKWHRKSFKPCS
jgi:ribonuclease HII